MTLFEIIYGDCPWRFRNWSSTELAVRGEKWARRNGRSPYDVMDLPDICALRVPEITAKNAACFLWATYPKLPEALTVMDAWGFEFKTVAFTWIKLWPQWERIFWKYLLAKGVKATVEKLFCFGLGYWTRQNPEIVLLGTRGKISRINPNIPNIVIAPRREHSRKPDEVRERIVQLVGDRSRVELFARPPIPPGWAVWGDQIEATPEVARALEVQCQSTTG